MARESNLLVLDEPTNDLDVETLDLLQELIADFDGTVLLVSHDRDFLDRVATTTIAMEGDGRAVIYAGGWSDYRAQRGGAVAMPGANRPARKGVVRAGPNRAGPKRAEPAAARLSFAQQKRLDDLPAEIDRLGAEIVRLEAFLSGPEVFNREPVKFRKASEGLDERQKRLAAAEEEWLELEALREALG
jgi:ATP-binding cassette subfamily F protein uup